MNYFLKIIVIIQILQFVGTAHGIIPSPENQSATASGLNLFHRLSCHGCHTIDDPRDTEGPDLMGVSNRLSRQELEDKLIKPRQHRSDSRMPSFSFVQPQELQDLLDFLQSLK